VRACTEIAFSPDKLARFIIFDQSMADSTSYYGNASAAAAPAAKPLMDQGKIFVGGLSWQTTEESLRWHFEQYGRVLSVEGKQKSSELQHTMIMFGRI